MIRTLKLLFVTLTIFLSHRCPAESIDDFSRLNLTHIHKWATPKTTHEILNIINYAQKNAFKISVVGSRHSQGGHAFCPDGIVIDLQKYNKVLEVDKKHKTITVQTGIT